MEVDADVHVWLHHFSDGSQSFFRFLYVGRRIDTPNFGSGVHFQDTESFVDLFGGGFADFRRAIAADPLIDSNTVTGATTK